MAPIVEEQVDDRLKDVIQDLYEIQSSIHGYLGPQTRDVLIQKIHDLTLSLSSLSVSASTLPPISIPPELIDYVETGRNPDVYTREFVESVQKFNMLLKGKAEAFRGFRDVVGEELVSSGMATVAEVDGIISQKLEDMKQQETELKKEG